MGVAFETRTNDDVVVRNKGAAIRNGIGGEWGEENKGFKKRITTEAAKVRRDSGEFSGGLSWTARGRFINQGEPGAVGRKEKSNHAPLMNQKPRVRHPIPYLYVRCAAFSRILCATSHLWSK